MPNSVLSNYALSVSEFGKLGAAERTEAIGTQIQDAVRSVLGKDVDPGEPLMEAGLDSLGAVEMSNTLSKNVGLELPSTFVIDYPTVASMQTFLVGATATAEPLPPCADFGVAAHDVFPQTDHVLQGP